MCVCGVRVKQMRDMWHLFNVFQLCRFFFDNSCSFGIITRNETCDSVVVKIYSFILYSLVEGFFCCCLFHTHKKANICFWCFEIFFCSSYCVSHSQQPDECVACKCSEKSFTSTRNIYSMHSASYNTMESTLFHWCTILPIISV